MIISQTDSVPKLSIRREVESRITNEASKVQSAEEKSKNLVSN